MDAKYPKALSVSIEWKQWDDFKREYAMPRDKDHPYFFLFYRIISLMCQDRRRNKERGGTVDPVDFVFDNQNEIGKNARGWYDWFIDHLGPEYREHLGAKPVFRDEKEVVALQSADMLAWCLRREALSAFMQPYQQRISVALQAYLSKVEPLTLPLLRCMAEDLRIGQKRS